MKKVFLSGILTLGLLLLCACGNSGNESLNASQPAAPAAPETPESPDSPEGHPVEPAPTPEASETPGTSENQPGSSIGDGTPAAATGEVTISFVYTRQSGPASNQHAIWIEDMDGNIIKTLFASRWTADGGFATRPDSIALWAGRAGLADMPGTEVDTFSGATPGTGTQTYSWDLTDSTGETIPQGDYMFFVEGTLRWKNYVLFSGVITIGDTPVTVQADPVFHFEGSDRYAALTADSVENDMIGVVTVEFTP